MLDTLNAIPSVGGGVLLIVLGAEVVEVPLEYGMELVAAAGNVLIPRRGRDRDCRAHINIYGSNELPASREGRIHGAPHNTYMASPGQARIGIPVSEKRRLDREHEVAWRSYRSTFRSTKGSKRSATNHILRVAALALHNIIQPAVSLD